MRIDYYNKIIVGASDLFYQHGIKKITMDDIARHLSISKKTIYKEFADKNEIVKAICQLDFSEHRKQIDFHQKHADNAINAMVQIMKYVHEYLDGINPNYFYDMQKYHPGAWNLYQEFKNKFIINSVVDNLDRGQKEGLYRKNLNIEIISRLRIAEMNAAMDTGLYPPNHYNLVDIHDELLRHYLLGIASIKGHELINDFFHFNKSDNAETQVVYAIKK